ncbi:hypothetical protein [Citrifermentans bremense]|uniref:hypothetical protein n=1 Tax=Citrifermentans bremense TaxID=60035 RepID=UPI0004194894|nr:hypothetical protein [Citrifermentans bremense]
MDPGRISTQLRYNKSRSLSRRRGIVGLSLLAAGSMGLIALYQAGIIRHIPEPPLPRFDADKVVASEEAYAVLHTPDAPHLPPGFRCDIETVAVMSATHPIIQIC